MLLSLVKGAMKNLTKSKYLILISFNLIAFLGIFVCFSQDLGRANSSGSTVDNSKLEVKVSFDEDINNPSFFSNPNLSKYLEVGQVKKLKGLWSGSYQLTKKSIFWINPKLNKNEIINSIQYGPYKILLNFNLGQDERLESIDIGQEDIMYGSINVGFANKKQINYTATANTDKWFQVIRGKVFRVNKDNLLTVFQTTVYEKKTPIYAFEGIAVLVRADK